MVPPVACVAADESRNVLLGAAVEHLTESEEVLLANAQRKLPDGVAEGLGEVPLKVAEGVDAVGIDVKPGDDVLIGPD